MDMAKKVNDLYASKDVDDIEQLHTSVTFKVTVNTAFMLSAIAEQFDDSRSTFGGEILDEACIEIFRSLHRSDRELLAPAVDDKVRNFLKDKGFTVTTYHGDGEIVEGNGPRDWTRMNYITSEYEGEK